VGEGLWQPIPRLYFARGNADLAGGEDGGHRWLLDGDGCMRIDTEVVACPSCAGLDTGPVYRCPE
jgi:hypothetical protein